MFYSLEQFFDTGKNFFWWNDSSVDPEGYNFIATLVIRSLSFITGVSIKTGQRSSQASAMSLSRDSGGRRASLGPCLRLHHQAPTSRKTSNQESPSGWSRQLGHDHQAWGMCQVDRANYTHQFHQPWGDQNLAQHTGSPNEFAIVHVEGDEGAQWAH